MKNSTKTCCQRELFDLVPRGREVLDLFEYLPGICLYVKNRLSQFVKVNAAMLANHGVNEEAEMLGKTDRDFHPPALAEAYIAEDRRVMDDRRLIPNQVWLVPCFQKKTQWYVSSKTPLFAGDDEVVGIVGVMYPIKTPKDKYAYFRELLPGIRHIDRHFTEKIRMPEMAALAGLSTTHFNRRFRELLRMSPTEYILSLRVQYARGQLTEGSESMAQIAVNCGFSDQSHFAKRFSKATGITPRAYRNCFRQQKK